MEAPGEKLLLRLWETIAEKGIGSLLRPWQIRREGRAQIDLRREELLMLAQTERDAEDIRSGRKRLPATADGTIEATLAGVTPVDVQTLARAISGQLIADTLRREVHVAKALMAAEADLENDPQAPPPRTVDEDWLLRWRDYAGAVSSEELQNLWGRLLAGEVKSPGQFSLRTLEFLKNLSSQEATEIARLSPFVIADFIVRDDTLLDPEGITFGYLLRLQQLGVVSGVEAISLLITLKSVMPDRFVRALVSHGNALVVMAEDPSKEIKLPVYQVTLVGHQLLRLGTFESNERYLRAVGEKVRAQGFEVRLARWQQMTETQGHYFDAQPL
jgi:hypothetical protein